MRNKTPWSLLLALVMLLQMVLPTAWAEGGALLPPAWWTAAVTDGHGNALDGQEIRDDTEVRIDYTFTVPDEEDIQTGAPYTLTTLPDGFRLPGVETQFLEDEGGVLLATVTIHPNGLVTILFTEEAAALSELQGQFRLDRRFDQSQIGNQTEVVFEVGAGNTVTIRIEQPPVFDSSITKADGQLNTSTGEITWRITIDPGSRPISDVTVIDSPDANQEFVANSIRVDGIETFACDFDLATLTCTFDEVRATRVITYQTRVTALTFGTNTLGTITLQNSADLVIDGTHVGSASGTYVAPAITWIEKAGRLVMDEGGLIEPCTHEANNANGCEIEWTITVNKNGHVIPAGTTVTDVLPAYLDFAPGIPFVVGNQFAYTFDEETREEHTFTLLTRIDPEYYNQQAIRGFENRATLAFGGASAVGIGRVNTDQGSGVPTSLISKGAGGYNPATHEITWKITVNSNKVTIGNATVTDQIPAGQAFVADSLLINDQSADESQYELDSDGLLTIHLGNLDRNSSPVQIQFRTEVTVPEHFAANSSKTYANTAILEGIGIARSSDTATQPVNSTVLRKSAGTYDYTTHQIAWTIVVNDNKMPMTGVTVTDVIPAGQAFVPGSVTLANGPAGWTSSHSNGTLTIQLGDITDRYTITFRTEITDTQFLAQNVSRNFSNTAQLRFQVPGYPSYDGNVQVSATKSVKNTIVEKNALAIDKNEAYIDWQVALNSGLLQLANGSISDTLQTGLELDAASLKLFKGTVNPSSGVVTANLEVPLSWGGAATATSGSVSYDRGQFVLNLPTPTSDAYVLTFRTDLTASFSKVVNQISMSGTGVSESSRVEKAWTFDLSGVASGKTGSITVVKVDAKDEAMRLPGAVFELLDQMGNVLREATTNGNGEAVFSKLKFRTFYIREKVAPVGYQRSTEDLTFTLSGADAGQAHVVRQVKNETLKTSIEFRKVSDADRPLSGAEFALYRRGEAQPFKTAVSGGDGKVSFTNVEAGEYTIRETKAPSGYVESVEAYDVEVHLAPGNPLVLVGVPEKVVNKPRPFVPGPPPSPSPLPPPVGNIVIHKTGADQKPLAGAEFTLYNASGGVVKTAVSQQDGSVTFQGVPIGTYTIRETAAPSGYLKSDRVIQAVVQANGTVALDTNTIVNTPDPAKPVGPVPPVDPKPTDPKPVDPNAPLGRLVITKTDEAKNPLAGAEFTLYDARNRVVATAVSGTDGRVVFDQVEQGAYTIVETKAPAGYQRSALPISVTVDGSGAERIFTFTNTKFPVEGAAGSIRILKVDQDHRPLAGATFALINDQGETVLTGTSGPEGIVLFTGVAFGSYTIRETQMPEGYESVSDDLTVDLTSAETIELTVENRYRMEFGDLPGAGPGDRSRENPNGPLPDSGGMLGTNGLVLIGLALILGGAGLAALNRKRKTGTAK